MSSFWKGVAKFIANNIESINVKNTEEGPQILLNPSGTVRELIEVVQKGLNNGKEATQEDQQTTNEANRKAT